MPRLTAAPSLPRLLPLLLTLALLGAGTGPSLAASQPATPAGGDRPWWRDAVCYEVFVRSFADSDGDGIGDLPGLTARLDDLNDGDPTGGDDLGVDCLWLMPIMDAVSYHGYDVVDYERVEPDYGTNDDLRAFVAAAHARGIRVLLDLVLNHTSSEHPWFQDALAGPNAGHRDWYIWSEEDPAFPGSFGQDVWHEAPNGGGYFYGTFWEGMPDLNYRNPEVTAAAERISAFWLDEMGADGFRLDAVKHLIEDGRTQENTPATHAWLRDYRAFLEATAADAFTVGEVFNAGTFLLQPYFPDQLHAYFHFELAGQVLGAASSGGGGGIVALAAEATEQIPDAHFAPFLTNHDQTRAMTVLHGDVAAAKLAATALLTLPGTPFLYYGEEIGVTGDKPDPQLRAPIPWSGDPGGGFTTGQPWQPFAGDPATLNVADQLADPASLLNHYRALIALRATHPALAHGGFVPLCARPRSLAAFVRQAVGDDGETVLVVVNFGTEPVADAVLSTDESPLATGAYSALPLLDHDPGATLTVSAGGAVADYAPLPTLAPQSAYLFLLTPLPSGA